MRPAPAAGRASRELRAEPTANVTFERFVSVLEELSRRDRTHARADKTSAHVELVNTLLLLAKQGRWMCRVPPRCFDTLFYLIIDWITDDGSERRRGPHQRATRRRESPFLARSRSRVQQMETWRR